MQFIPEDIPPIFLSTSAQVTASLTDYMPLTSAHTFFFSTLWSSCLSVPPMLWAVPVMWTCRTESLLTFRFRTPVLLTKNSSELFCHHHAVSDPFILGSERGRSSSPLARACIAAARSFHACVKLSPRISLFCLAVLCLGDEVCAVPSLSGAKSATHFRAPTLSWQAQPC